MHSGKNLWLCKIPYFSQGFGIELFSTKEELRKILQDLEEKATEKKLP